MAEYTKQTDEVKVVTLESKIIQVYWGSRLAIQEEKIEFEVWTQFVGNRSKIEIKVEDKKGKSVAKSKGEVFDNQFRGAIIVPKKAKETITFTAKLPDHGLEMKSAPATVIPAIEVAYHLGQGKPLLECLGAGGFGVVLCLWAVTRRNTLLPLLAHGFVELVLVAFLLLV